MSEQSKAQAVRSFSRSGASMRGRPRWLLRTLAIAVVAGAAGLMASTADAGAAERTTVVRKSPHR